MKKQDFHLVIELAWR